MPNNALSNLRAHHVALRVPNYDETVRWYQDKLGFEMEVDWREEDRHLCYLRLGDFSLEVVGDGEVKDYKPEINELEESMKIEGYHHLCFRVESVDDVLAALNKQGVETFLEPVDLREKFGGPPRKNAFVRDNSGNLVEFTEYL